MKQSLCALGAGLLGFAAVGLDVGCDGNSSYPYDDYGRQEDCKTTSKSPVKSGRCAADDDDDDVDDPNKGEPEQPADPGIVKLAADQDVACMTVDVDAAYWIRRDGTIAALPTTDVPSSGRPLIVESSVHADPGAGPCALVREGSYLWLTAFKDGAVRRLSVRKNADRTVSFEEDSLTVPGFVAPSSIALDETSVYVAEHDSGSIRRFAKPGAITIGDAGAPDADAGSASDAGATIDTIAAAGTKATQLVLDADSIYWLSYTSGDAVSAVRRVAKTGGAVTTLAPADVALQRIGGALYFLRKQPNEVFASTVSTAGGLATRVLSESAALGLTTDGASLFVASGTRFYEVGAEGQKFLFVYATPPDLRTSGGAAPLFLFAQPNRLVWALGKNIATRVIE